MDTTTHPTTDVSNEAMTAVQKLREQADAVVQRIQPQIAAVSTYAREEPIKSLLISAAAGAALMGLIALVARSGGRSSASSLAGSTMAAIREAALDLADSAQSMVADVMDATQKRAAAAVDGVSRRAAAAADGVTKRATAAADGVSQRAAAAADDVSGAVADAWQKVRDQAAPVVDRVRPQLEAATTYVKDDPARAALGLATIGAIVAGLYALSRRSDDDAV